MTCAGADRKQPIHRILVGVISRFQQGLHAIVAIPCNVPAQHGFHWLTHGLILSVRADVADHGLEIVPEGFRHVARVHLVGKQFHGLTPCSQCVVVPVFIPIQRRNAV